MARLADRVILVTGSATGVGEGIARRVASEGAHVVVHGREEERETGERLADDLGAVFLAGELEDPGTPSHLVEAAVAELGRLDGLVNNAGVSWRGGLGSTAEFFDRVMAINARAPFLMTQAAYPHLKASGGCVVSIGSVNAHRGAVELTPYSMSKSALATMTRNLSGILAEDGIRINALHIGWTLTPNERRLLVDTYGWKEDWPEEMAARMPLKRLLDPADVGGMVAYLLSDEAAMVTGQVWDFDQRTHGG